MKPSIFTGKKQANHFRQTQPHGGLTPLLTTLSRCRFFLLFCRVPGLQNPKRRDEGVVSAHVPRWAGSSCSTFLFKDDHPILPRVAARESSARHGTWSKRDYAHPKEPTL